MEPIHFQQAGATKQVVNMKMCTDCKIEKDGSEFTKLKRSPDGLYRRCRACKLEKERNKPKFKPNTDDTISKICSRCNISKTATKSFFFTNKRSEFGLEGICKECHKKRLNENKQLVNTDPEITKICTSCNMAFPATKQFFNCSYFGSGESSLKTHCRMCMAKDNRRLNDVGHRLHDSIRRSINSHLGGRTKTCRSLQYLGCSIEKFKDHLESQFTDGMSWDNYGEWQMDHIRPISSFPINLYKPGSEGFEAMLKRTWNYTNFQPLWASQNARKHDRFIHTWQSEFDDQVFYYQHITSMVKV